MLSDVGGSVESGDGGGVESCVGVGGGVMEVVGVVSHRGWFGQ